MSEDRCLLLSPEAPYPIRTGGAMRTAALLEYLRQRYTVDAIFFAQPGETDPRERMPSGCVAQSITIRLPFHGRGFWERARRNAGRWARGVPPLNDRFGGFGREIEGFARERRWSLGVVEHSWCAGYADILRPHCGRLVLNLHNVESELHARCAKTEPAATRWLHRRFAHEARVLETALLPRYDLVLATSERDRDLARALAPGSTVESYPNTVPARRIPASEKRMQIVFSGNLEYHPNRSGVAWFAREVWPTVRGRFPDCEWVLVGRNPEAVRTLVEGERVRLTGEVEDAMAEIAPSMVAVAPLLSGSGTRIKILEAWSAGVPVVSTPVGAEGLPSGGVLLAEKSGDFTDAISRLLDSAALRAEVGETGRLIFNQKFTWQAGWAVLESLRV
ncbi:MAG: glycosyltransferase [Bryobacteraceae bacterium]